MASSSAAREPDGSHPMIAVCLKWVDRRVELDAGGRAAFPDGRFAGVSAADQAALEWAMRCRDAWPGETVVALTVGPAPAEAILVDALAAGADQAIRIDTAFDSSSRSVARLLGEHLAGATMILCGDYSLDRGTGSVPAFLAAELGIGQALGLVELTIGATGMIEALRRVDGGRRDRLAITAPAVLSVEGSTARLRRASLRSKLSRPLIELVATPPSTDHLAPGVSRPYRPRPRMLPAPAGASALERVKALTAVDSAVAHGDPVVLDADAAADRILAALREWDYLPK